MSIKIRIPAPLRTLTGTGTVEVAGSNVSELLKTLSEQFQGMDVRLFSKPGELNRFINIYVNNEDIRFLNDLDTIVKDGDEISIVPAIAGG